MPLRRRAAAAFGPPRTAAEWKALFEALSIAFEVPLKDSRKWVRKAGRANFRVLRMEGGVAGGLALYPMAHWFGGRSVPSLGVAGVAVLPHFRARGVASRMMRESVLESARRGAPISVLFPATHPVYRGAGYEIAGHWEVHTIPVSSLDARERDPAVRPARPGDRRAIREIYRESARPIPGMVDRNEYFWWRATGRGEKKVRTWVVEGPRGPEGYFVLEQDKRSEWPGPAYDLDLLDFAFRTPAAGRRMISFLAAHRSMAGDLGWVGGPADPLLGLLGEPFLKTKKHGRWMLRVADLAGAIAKRGFPSGVEGAVDLDVDDDLAERNRGRWTIRVVGGRGKASRGGSGRVRITARGLAPLWTGFQSPFDLRTAGLLDGPDGDLERLAPLFAGPAPWMRDGF